MSPRFRSLPVVLLALACAAAGARAQTPVSATAKGVTKSTPKPKATTAPRIRAVPKTPFAGLESRGSNPTGPFAKLNEVQRDSIVENSRSLLGIRYKWAGATPERGLDCSGLVQYVFAKLGLAVPHHAADLAKLGQSVAKDTSDMRIGDLLVFSKLKSKRISHVGIYVGDGMMVHASSTSKAVVETPVVEYRDKMNLRGVRRLFAVDSAVNSPQP
jgi:cell wall-associated NlpC family hydrolase